MSHEPLITFEQMCHSCRRILAYRAALTFGEFTMHEMAYDAILWQLLVLGEAARRVPESARGLAPDVDWRRMVGLRNVAIHQYDAIDDEIVWDVVQTKIEPLLAQLDALLQEPDDGNVRLETD